MKKSCRVAESCLVCLGLRTFCTAALNLLEFCKKVIWREVREVTMEQSSIQVYIAEAYLLAGKRSHPPL